MTVQRKVSQLPSVEQFTGDEYFVVGYNGRSYKTTMNKLTSHFNDGVDASLLFAIREELARIPDLSSFTTAAQLQEAISALNIEVPDISSFLNQEQVNALIQAGIESIEFPQIPDIGSFITETLVDEKINQIQFPAAPDLSSYATSEYVDEKISQIQIPTVPDVTGFATKLELSQSVGAIQIPDVSGFVTDEQVNEKINQIQFPEVPDVSNLAVKTEVEQAIETAVANTQKTSDSYTGNVLWVSGDEFGEEANGSIHRPFADIQQAVDAAAADDVSKNWVIQVMPKAAGHYTGFVVDGFNSLLIQGYGGSGAKSVIVQGTVRIQGNDTTGISLKDIAIQAPDEVAAALELNGTQGYHNFDNLYIERLAGTGNVVVVDGLYQNKSTFTNCSIDGGVMLDVAGTNAEIQLISPNNANTVLYIEDEYKVIIRNGTAFSYIEHVAGSLEVTHTTGFTGLDGVAIESTNGANVRLAYVDFEKPDGVYNNLIGLSEARKVFVSEAL